MMKKSLILKLVIVLMLFIPMFGMAQKSTVDRPDELVEVNPYNQFYFSAYINYENA